MRYVKERWPQLITDDIKNYKKIENYLSVQNGCLFYGLRGVIPKELRNQTLNLLHLGHFSIQRIKQLTRSIVYWPKIDYDIQNEEKHENHVQNIKISIKSYQIIHVFFLKNI